MSLFYTDAENDIRLYVWKLEETCTVLYRLLGNQASCLEKQCEKRFRSETKKLEWLAVRVLLRIALGENVSVLYRSNGEPYLAGSNCKISISHTKQYVCLAIHPYRHIGVDIEAFSHRIDYLVSRIMHPSEKPDVPLAGDNATLYSLMIWSMKESVYKCLDMAMLDYQYGIRIDPFLLEKKGKTSATYRFKGFCYPLQVHYLYTSDYVLTWCQE